MAKSHLLLALCAALLIACEGEFVVHDAEDTGAACVDGKDNDGDGRIDCADTDCAAFCGTPVGDAGPSGLMDAGLPPAPDGGAPPWPVCAETSGEAKLIGGEGVDIIWAVDSSASMFEEIAAVTNNLNNFATFIGAQSIDYHVILMGTTLGPPILCLDCICIPQPLGGPNCTDGPRYRYIHEQVSSTDALELLVEHYPKYKDFLRPQTTKHFVVVTDDNSAKSADWFKAELAKLTDPGFAKGFVFHSIVGYGTDTVDGCPTAAEYGEVYVTLSDETGGAKFPICEPNWTPIFTQLAQAVVQTVKPPCSYELPSPGAGKKVNPKQILVTYSEGSSHVAIPQLENAAACAGDTHGFYYDDVLQPTVITFCPTTCNSLGAGTIKVVFGCNNIG